MIVHHLKTGIAIIALTFAGLAQAGEDDDPREGGLTGTGIVGLITVAGDVEVNGQPLVVPPDLSIESPLGATSLDSLPPGSTIATQVARDGNVWAAQSVAAIYPIIGPVSAVGTDMLTVMGTTIEHDGSVTAAKGDWIAVSGLWREDTIIASRIEIIPAQQTAHITGTFFPPTDLAKLRIGQTLIAASTMPDAAPGDVIHVTGQAVRTGIIVDTVEIGHFDADVAVILGQGYLSPPDTEGHYALLGTGLHSITDNPMMIDSSNPILSCGVEGELVKTGMVFTADMREALKLLGCIE